MNFSGWLKGLKIEKKNEERDKTFFFTWLISIKFYNKF